MTTTTNPQLKNYTRDLIPRFENVFNEYTTLKEKEGRIDYYVRSIHDIAYSAYKNNPYTADIRGVNWYDVYCLITFKNYLFAAQLIVYK